MRSFGKFLLCFSGVVFIPTIFGLGIPPEVLCKGSGGGFWGFLYEYKAMLSHTPETENRTVPHELKHLDLFDTSFSLWAVF